MRVVVVAALAVAMMALAPLPAAQAASGSCTSSSLVSLNGLIKPGCTTQPVECTVLLCTLTGTVTASARIKLGVVGGTLEVQTADGSEQIAACTTRAAQCTANGGGQVVPTGSYAGTCGWAGGLLGVLANLSCTLTVTPCFGGAECPWQQDDMVSFAQGDWGATPNPSNAAGLLVTNYYTVYPDGEAEVGISGVAGFSMRFTRDDSILSYLPTSGFPNWLSGDYVDPLTTSSGALGGEVLALMLNVDFSDADVLRGTSGLRFGELVLCSNPYLTALNGSTVRDILGAVNSALGGEPALAGADIYDALIANLNSAFRNGTPSSWAQQFLRNRPCS